MERSARRLLRKRGFKDGKNERRNSRFHALRGESRRVDSRGKLSCVLERLRSEGERRREARGCASYLALEAGLVGETLETDLVEGIGGVTARSRRSGTTVSGWFGSCDRGVSAPALRCRRFPPKKSKRRRGDAGGCSPDELAEEDLLVRVEGLRGAKEWRGQIRSRRLAKPSAEGAPKVGAGSSLACRDSAGRKRRAREPSRGDAR